MSNEYYLRNLEKMREYHRNRKRGYFKPKKKNEYAIYKGDSFLFLGTVEEIANHFGVKKSTVYFWNSPAYKKRCLVGYKIAIKV